MRVFYITMVLVLMAFVFYVTEAQAVSKNSLEFKGHRSCDSELVLNQVIKEVQSKVLDLVPDAHDFIAPREWVKTDIIEGKHMCMCIVLYLDSQGPAFQPVLYMISEDMRKDVKLNLQE